MVWFKVDDNLATHPKARAAGLQAMGLWTVCGALSSQQLSEGFVPDWYVQTWPQGRRLAARLVEVGLWSVAEGGWLFHQWDERNPSKAKVVAKREQTKERVAAWRARNNVTDVVTPSVTNAVSNAVSNGAPDPTRPEKKKDTPSSELDGEFDKFWTLYPRKVGKAQARTAYRAARRKATEAQVAAALHDFRRAAARMAPEHVAHPSTWLRREPWHDDPDALAPVTNGHPVVPQPAYVTPERQEPNW